VDEHDCIVQKTITDKQQCQEWKEKSNKDFP
jgi:hypothetical protein